MVALTQEQDPMRMTEADYLEFEQDSDLKHEFVNGEVFAMTGASWKHNVICSNINITLGNQMLNKNCTVVSSDLRLKVFSKVSYRYPDLMVVCGEPQFVNNRVDTISNPIVILEVLSPATALVDRNDKLDEYLQLETLQEYVLVSQHEAKIERYLRQDSGNWLYTQAVGLQSKLDLLSIACWLPLSDIYNKVSLDSSDNEAAQSSE